MSRSIGFLIIASGMTVLITFGLKVFVQPFIPQDLSVHDYFPSDELIFGIPIFCGTVFTAGFGMYIFQLLLKGNLSR